MRLEPAKLKSARERLALSQEALARRCELSRKSVQRAEAGLEISDDTAALMAASLGLCVQDLRPAAPGAAGPATRLMLRRVGSGLRLFETLAQAYVGKITCDVDASGEIIGPLSRLIGTLQGLVSERWGDPVATARDLPLLQRLRIVSDLNDDLRVLETHGVRCFLGHYYRYVVASSGPDDEPGDGAAPVILARVHLADSLREAMTAPIEASWAGGAQAVGVPEFGAEARFVFLESQPPLAGRDGADGLEPFIEGEFTVASAQRTR